MKSIKTVLRLFIVFLILYIFSRGKLFAQTINRDSLRRVAFSLDSIREDSIANAVKVKEIARWDSRKQRLNPAETIRFKADEKNKNSDLFKPQKSYVSDTTLLLDSVYVKAFRQAAYERALDDNAKIAKCSWVALGYGSNTGSYNHVGNINLFLNGNLEISNNLLLTADLIADPGPYGNVDLNYAFLFGNIFKQKVSFLTASIGFELVNEITNSFLFARVTNTGIGIPILIQGYVVAAQSVGLGINVYANINTVKSSAGISISLAFGRLSTHERN